MNFFKTIFGNKGSVIWFSVTAFMLVLMLVVSILMFTVYSSVFVSIFGGDQPILAEPEGGEVAYIPDFTTKTAAREAGNKLNIKLNEEGIVLLKNENNALPLDGAKNISVFGKNSVNLVYGGSGSGSGSFEGRKTIYESLSEAGYSANPALKSFYEDAASGTARPSNPSFSETSSVKTWGIYESAIANYTTEVKNSYASYNDAALVVFSRIGGEDFDLPRVMGTESGARDYYDHYLQLDQNETDLLAHVCSQNFGHVIVIINSSASMELGFLDDPGHYAYNAKIDGALMIAGPGNSGIMALGSILKGDVTPSGHIADTFVRDFKKDPTWPNFANTPEVSGRYEIGKDISSAFNYAYVDYEEGIYSGYRYWETRGFTSGDGAYTASGSNAINGTTTTSWNSWYDAHVVYPFGYGMSYTDFSWEITKPNITNLPTGSEIKISVKVTNNGSYAGKDVVQLYVTPQYYSGGIEKSHKMLIGFAKTGEIQPKDSYTVDISFDAYSIASYDYNDKNGNGFKGFELDAGAYNFWVSKNAHTAAAAVPTFTLNLAEGYKYDKETKAKDSVSGEENITLQPAENRFADADDQLGSILSRANWEGTWPHSRTESERSVSSSGGAKYDQSFINELTNVTHNNPHEAEYAAGVRPDQSEIDEENKLVLKDMISKSYEDDDWDILISQMSVAEMRNLVSNGAFMTIQIESIDKPKTLETDGPVGFVNFMLQTDDFKGTCSYASEVLIAQTWNRELAFDMGKSVGNEGLVGNAENGGMPYSGWYAPGMNIHRSQFCGRNFEYYSECPFFSGIFAAEVTAGAESKGVYCYLKHFALNEQETDRTTGGLVTWVDEQAMREIYLRQFEICVKDGKTRGIMSSFNRIGTKWAGGDYRLLTEVLRDEWGFRGTVISDFMSGSYMNAKQMHYAGGDLNLTNEAKYMWKAEGSTSTADLIVLRNCTKNILYTVANSNVYNVDILGYMMPMWKITIIIIDVSIFVLLAAWGFFAIRSAYKKRKQNL